MTTTKAKGNGKAASGDLLAGIPEPPKDWLPSDFRDRNGPWLRGLAQVHADGADDSGPRKSLAFVVPLAWAVHLVGGSIHTWRQRLAMAQIARAQIEGRIVALERRGTDSTEARGELVAADKNIATPTALIAAAEQWEGVDNAILRQQYEGAVQQHQWMVARIEPYKRARLPLPDPSWERDLFESEKAVSVATAAFNAARERFDALGEALKDATEKAFQALAGALVHVEDRLGESCARIIHDADPEFLSSFPARAPDALLPIYARAVIVSENMDMLGASYSAGMGRFWLACGEVGRDIVRGKVQAGSAFYETGMNLRPREPHPDPIMREVY